MQSNIIKDLLNRPIQDLRISVIDRCNFRCPYCMPEEEYSKHYSFLKQNDWLTFDEIIRLARLFVRLGVRKIRLTGGEPLLRPNLSELVRELNKIDGIDDLALTTNGSLLSEHAKILKEAGLKRLTVSLDTLDARVFKYMSGQKGDVKTALEGMKAAEEAGFENMKVNVVVQRGVNDHTLLDLIEFFRGTSHVIRFIEYMDVGNCNHWDNKYVVPNEEIIQKIHALYPLEKILDQEKSAAARSYRYRDGKGEIGFISSISQPFCRSCVRARLSTDGKLFTCLFAGQGVDLRTPLRGGASDAFIRNRIEETWRKREDRYSELRFAMQEQALKKVEMFQIGG